MSTATKTPAPKRDGRNIKVKNSVHKQIRIKAAKRGMTMGELVEKWNKEDKAA